MHDSAPSLSTSKDCLGLLLQFQVEVAFTSEEAESAILQKAQMYPSNPEMYRHVNLSMEKELILYKREIERRFRRSEMRDYQFPRPGGQRP